MRVPVSNGEVAVGIDFYTSQPPISGVSYYSKISTDMISDELTKDDVFRFAGQMFFKLHGFEQLLGTCTGILIATNQNRATEGEIDATELIWKMGERTCGSLLAELRKVVNIETSFEKLLHRLRRRRNRFAHKLSWKRAFNPSLGVQALKNIMAFLLRLNADVEQAWDVFANYAEAITRQSDGDTTCIEYEKLVVPFLTLKQKVSKQQKP